MKLNNKGFAISTVIYGLSIMGIMLVAIIMGVISNSRANNTKISKSIEDELNRFSKTETSFDSSISGGQEFIVPEGESGWYKIELWGAQGGGVKGGRGAYTSGIIELNEGDILYFFVGKHGNSGTSGEESDVRIVNGAYDDIMSYDTRIMVAAGGSTDGNGVSYASSDSSIGAPGGTLYGYSDEMTPTNGLLNKDFSLYYENSLAGFGKNYKDILNSSELRAVHSFSGTPLTSPRGENGGGDGYIASKNPKIGGMSYIAGYAGSFAYEKGVMGSNSAFVHYPLTYNVSTGSYEYSSTSSGTYYFYDGMMFAGINEGDGKAKISKLMSKTDEVQVLPKHNSKLYGVKYAKICISGNLNYVTDTTYQPYFDFVSSGFNPLIIEESAVVKGDNWICYRATLDKEYDIDEIAAYFNGHFGEDISGYSLSVGGADDSNCSRDLRKPVEYWPAISESHTVTGIRVSAYQFDSSEELPAAGNYYIMPVLSENMVMTAQESSEKDLNPITIDHMNGYKRQQWSIERVGDGLYKVVELARFKALQIYHDENKIGNTLVANSEFNSLSQNDPQIWRIQSLGNGTYTIETVVEPYAEYGSSGYIVPQTNPDEDNYNAVIIGKINVSTQRFKLISTDYSSS